MPVKQRKAKGRAHKITPEAIAAWKSCDFMALHRSLGLYPWEASPLPDTITSLGVSEETAASIDPDTAQGWGQSFPQAIELQRALIAAAGWPNCRAVYEKNLFDAENRANYCEHLNRHPERGGQGTGCDMESRQAALEDALEEVEYRRALLDELDEQVAK
jgi:hypothetical protein